MTGNFDNSMWEAAFRYLKKQPLFHTDMTETLRSGDGKLLWAGEHGVLLQTAGVTMISAEEESTARQIMAVLPKTDLIEVHQDFYREALQRKTGLSCGVVCRQAAWMKKKPLLPVPEAAEIRPLSVEALPFIMQHYKHADDEEYLRDRLQSGCMWGAYRGECLTGFIGIHEEGSMGFLQVIPEYQRQGIAAQLETFLANRMISCGRVPFAQIETDNQASFALHRKLGFEISKQQLYWLMIC